MGTDTSPSLPAPLPPPPPLFGWVLRKPIARREPPPEEWKERGVGLSRFLRHNHNGRVRYLLRQEATGKLAANHYVFEHDQYCVLRPSSDSAKAWVWMTVDYADGESTVESFAVKFGSEGLAAKFKEAFEDAVGGGRSVRVGSKNTCLVERGRGCMGSSSRTCLG